MIRFISCALLLACVGGCAAPGASSLGNFSAAPVPVQQQLAEVAVRQLVLLHPPGSTRFTLQQPVGDAFGQPLVAGLRARGYALQDFKAQAEATVAPGTPAMSPPAALGMPLGYVLDQVAGLGLYRISLVVGSQTLTRVYEAHEGKLAPAGAWVRKE